MKKELHKVLFISDIHGYDLSYFIKSIEQIKEDYPRLDLVIYLGDIDTLALKILSNQFRDFCQVGVHGNHDTHGDLEYYEVKNINGEIFSVNDVRIWSVEGSKMVSKDKMGIYTRESDIVAPELNTETVDILISHSNPSVVDGKDKFHEGLSSLSKIIEKFNPEYHFFGHLHENKEHQYKQTKLINIYGLVVYDFTHDEKRIYRHI